jgi:xanthine/CO dehydrogenase XdhC/CoxF family maturation factor
MPRLLHYDTGADDRTVWGLGLGCNGSVDVFVQAATEPRTLEALREMQTRLPKTSPFVVSTTAAEMGMMWSMRLSGLSTGSSHQRQVM